MPKDSGWGAATLPTLQLADVAHDVSDLICEIDEEGRFLYVSPACREILGYEPEELMAIETLDLVHPDDRKEARRAYVKAALGGEPVLNEHRARHRDGSWVWLQDTAHAFRTESGELRFAVIGRDVTARRESEDTRGRQLLMQEQIAEASRHFLSLSSAEIADGVRRHLPEAARLARAERTRLLVSGPNGEGIDEIFTWSEPAFEHANVAIDVERTRAFRWSRRKLMKGEPVCVEDVAALPPEADAERRDFERRGVRACLVVPIRSAARPLGYQIFECMRGPMPWSPQEITMLSLLGEIFAAALQRRKAEEALRESEERFRAIAEHATELIAEFDGEGRYSYLSPSYEDLLGYEPGQLLGRNGNHLVHPDDRDDSTRRFSAAVSAEGASRSLHRLRHSDGSWRWFDNAGRAFRMASGELRFVSLGRDITESMESAEALERQLEIEKRIADLSRRFMAVSSRDFDAALHQALGEVADLAGADRCYLLSFGIPSAAPFDYFEWCAEGIASSEARAMPWATKHIVAGNLFLFRTLAELPAEATEERRDLEGRGVRSILGIPMMSGETLTGFLAFESMGEERDWTQREITRLRLVGDLLSSAVRRHRTEHALRESQSQLLQAQKMDAVGRLAGGIAHDFNNLLTVILGFSRPLLRELPEGDWVRDDVSEIHAAAERAAALTGQLLTFSRRGMVETQPLEICRVIEGIEDMLRRLLGETVELFMDLEAPRGSVRADPNQIEQVLVNLAVNARDAMPQGGRLELRTHRREIASSTASRLGLALPGPYLHLSVTDSGGGMDDSLRERIFEPFFTTKEPGRGTGLGLAIVYGVIEQCGGSISVRSKPGRGTTFDIHLPLSDMQVPSVVHETEREEKGGGGCILVAEDEDAVRRLTCRILRANGYEVLEASDGLEALEVARAHSGRIDALVTDVVMPRMGGIELATELRVGHDALRVLFVSGYPEEPEGEGPVAVASGDFLQKPFREEALLDKLRSCLES